MTNIERIQSFAELKPNWYCEGATPPSRQVIARAIVMMDRCEPPCRVAAFPSGSILLEWRNMGTYKEAEISDSPVIEWMERHPGKPAKHWQTPSGIEVAQ